jgi:hypothetical protein
MDTETMAKALFSRYRAVHVTIYDLQAGPIPPDVVKEISKAAQEIAKRYQTLAVDVKEG